MRIKLFILCALLSLGAQAKKYEFETVKGDMTKTRIYTLDNGLKVYLSGRQDRIEERPCRDDRSGALPGAPDV